MEPGQGFMNWKGLLIIAAVAAGAYFLFFRNSSSSAAAPTSTGGSGTITTGNTTVDSGAVTVNVSQGNPGGSESSGSGSQPTPPGQTQIPGHHTIQSTGKETLAQIAKRYNTTAADIIKFTEAHKTHVSPTEKKFFSHPTGNVPRGIVLWVPEPQVYGTGSGTTVNPGGPNVPATS